MKDTFVLNLIGLDCAHCAAKIEEEIKKLNEIDAVKVDFMSQKCTFVSSQENKAELVKKIKKIVNDFEPDVIVKEKQLIDCKLTLHNLDCAHCAAKIEEEINKLNNIESFKLNFINKEGNFKVDPQQKITIINEIKKIVSKIEPDVIVSESKETVKKDINKKNIIISGALLLIFGLIFKNYNIYIGNIFVLVAYIILGYDVLLKALKNIFKGQVFDENFLMGIATVAAIVLGEYFEAGAVMLFYQIGELFQDNAVKSTRKNISKLMDIRPDSVRVLRGNEMIVSPELVEINEIIVVNAGEKIALDGIVIEGASSIDTSSLTGESLLKDVSVDDVVVSGCVNVSGTLKIKVNKLYHESTVSKILELVENTGSRKVFAEKFITRFARVYTPVVVSLAALIAVLLPIFTNLSWAQSIKRACILLIISCPCALVISIPLGFFSGIGGLSKIGVLVKGSTVLESLAKIKKVIFDKTGTLTHGQFYVEQFSNDETLKLAAMAEINSNHPIAKSIVKAYGKDIDKNSISHVKEEAGYGISCVINNEKILAGNARLMDKHGIKYETVDNGTVVYVAKEGQYIGSIVIKDKIKDNSLMAIQNFKAADINDLYMVSGDNKKVANEVARYLGINNVYAECLPDKKLAIVKNLMDKEIVAFVGDGINDAPVLSYADVGIAMGALGSDAAIEAADVVVMDDNLNKIVKGIEHGKKTLHVIKANIVFSLAVKILVIVLGVFGIANMWLAIFADVGVSVICILNSIALLKINYK